MGQKETAQQIWDYFTARGWTKEAVAGMLGNMQSESGIIADRWEGDRVGNMSGGYGLVQWTPATKYINWAQSNGLVYQEVISQCKRLEWEVANNQQWIHPNMTFAQFTQQSSSPEQCALLFITYYERPANPNQPARQTQARHWYNLFKDSGGIKPTNEGVVKMFCLYKKGSAMFFFNGVAIKTLTDPAQIEVVKAIYHANNGKGIPIYDWDNNPTAGLLESLMR